MVQRCLLFIAYFRPELKIAELLQAISTPHTLGEKLYESNTIKEREILRRCSSLIRKSEDGQYFEFAHFSVQEFLEDKTALLKPFSQSSLEAYFISREIGERVMAGQCLKFLQLENFDQCPTSEEHAVTLYSSRHAEFPFYHKAALQWLKLTDSIFKDDDEGDANILELMNSLFHPRKTSNFIVWALEILAIYFNIASSTWKEVSPDDKEENPFSLAWNTIIKGTFRPLHLAAALNIPELCDHLLKSDTALCTHSQLFRSFELSVISVIGLSLSKYPMLKSNLDWKPLKDAYIPSASRRNSTINLLFQGDRKLTDYSPLLKDFSIFSTTLMLASCFLDWTPTVKLLSAGEIPSAVDFDILEKSLERFLVQPHGKQQLKQSTLALLMFLKDKFEIESDWGYQMSSMVWLWALDFQVFSSESDAPGLDSRITMSQEALHAKACLAVLLREHEELKHLLADKRLNLAHKSETYHGMTLLHLAMEEAETTIVEMLLDAGCDPYILDGKGLYPLHVLMGYVTDDCLAILELFSTRGLSLSSTDANGYTIWHHWAQDFQFTRGFLEKLYTLDCEASKTALKAKCHDGHTPLTLLFKSIADGKLVDEHMGLDGFHPENQVHKAEQVIQMSNKLQGFWDSHPNIFGRVARAGSVELVQALLAANAPLDPGQTESCTPLHQLGPRASVECFELLLSLYPTAANNRFGGSLPIELFLQRAVDDQITPKSATLEAFIKSTKLSSTIKDLPSTIQLFKQCTSLNEIDTSFVFLNHGLDVHQRVDGVSLIEYVCSSPDARRLSCTSQGRAFLSELFNHTRKEELNTSALAGPGKGLTLLHALLCNHRNCNCSGECSGGIPWLIKELVSRGVNLNSRCKEAEDETPLCYYLDRNYFQYAELLLDLGADPTLRASASRFGPAQFAVRANNSAFLKKLLEHANEHSTTMQWERSFSACGYCANHPNGIDLLQRIKLLHLASHNRSVECLELLLSETRTLDVNETTAEGYTPLHFALMGSRGDHLAVMRILLSKGADLSSKGGDGNTPLHFAAWNGNLSAIKFLLDHGAMQSFNVYRKTPKCYALQQGHDSIVQLLESTRSSSADQCSEIKQGFALEKREKFLAMAFENAIKAGDLATCKTLVLEGCPIDVKMPRNKGKSPLTAALLFKREKILEWLLNSGASVLRSQLDLDPRSRSPLEIAAATPVSMSLVALLLKRYVSEGGDLVHGEDYPLHEAVQTKNIQGLEFLLKAIKNMDKTISYVVKLIIYPIVLSSMLTF